MLACYVMGDPHFGMYAWASECGDDFDLRLAKRLTYAAIDQLVSDAPAAEHALIVQLGDFFHGDDSKNQTPGSGHALDIDSRHARVMEIGLDAMVYVIRAALRKHRQVTVRIVSGNHDPQSSIALRLMLAAYFHNEPRVNVDKSPAAHWYFKFGRCLIGATHGDKSKPKELGAIMATDRPEDWGNSDFRYFYHGHFHSKKKDTEHPGCEVEGFQTLAPKDAWHAGQGYRSGRSMTAIILHKKYGERFRIKWPIQMLGAKSSRNTARLGSKSGGSAARN